LEQHSPNLYYLRITILGTGNMERGHNGEIFWEQTPFNTRVLEADEIAEMAADVDFFAVLNHSTWYPEILQQDSIIFGGETCDRLIVQTSTGRKEALLFSQASNLLIGVIKLNADNSEDAVIRYGQYLDQGAVKIPMYWEEKRGEIHKMWKISTVHWDSSKFNFQPPKTILDAQ